MARPTKPPRMRFIVEVVVTVEGKVTKKAVKECLETALAGTYQDHLDGTFFALPENMFAKVRKVDLD